MNSQYQQKSSDRKRANPLIDLVETEKLYIADLRCLLQRITSCWSSENLLPPELDAMFLAIEEIFKRNKKFYSKLSKLGASSQSANEFGDVLMAWIDEMEVPYTNYCNQYCQGFDDRRDIEENLTLQQALNDISAETNQPVSLDYFFDVPIKRLHYYKKFYMRLFKSTEPGHSDHDILASVNKRLDRLIDLEKRAKESNSINPMINSQKLYPNAPSYMVDERTITPVQERDFPSNYSPMQDRETHSPMYDRSPMQDREIYYPLSERIQQDHIHSPKPQRLHSPISPIQDYDYPQTQNQNYSQNHEPIYTEIIEPSISNYFPDNTQSDWNILDLQDSIDTSKTFDILTKQPRRVNLVLQPPNLPFKREIILQDEFVIEVPEYDSNERFHVRAHLFLLTDLLLVCQKIEVKDRNNIPNFKYWLMYQPLSGKNLSVRDISYEEGEILELTVLRDETMIIFPQSNNTKNVWFNGITNAIKFASAGAMRPQVNTDFRNLNSPSSSPRTLSTSPNNLTPNSAKSLSRSPTNLGPSPTSTSPIIGLPTRPNQHLSGNFSNNLDPLSRRSRTLDVPNDASGGYDYNNKPTNYNYNQGQDRTSDPSSSSIIHKSQSLSSLKRSNSISSLKSVASIAIMRETIYTSPPCQISYWVNGNWRPLTKDLCIVEVRLTTMNKGCWAVLLQKSDRMILNAWIYSHTTINRDSPNTVTVSCDMGLNKEYYRISMPTPEDSDQFFANLNKVLQLPTESPNRLLSPQTLMKSRSSSLRRSEDMLREVEMQLAMECRCKLFLQNDHGKWTNLGWGNMKLEVELPSQRRRIEVNSEKQNKKLVDAFVRDNGVERVGKAGVAITLSNIGGNKRIIYMMQMKEEATAVKAFGIMKQGR